jgi:methylenetetrahydrofolate dehydrogenase (NADP+)/methenyltetrahydrofolate cyclohydrolase
MWDKIIDGKKTSEIIINNIKEEILLYNNRNPILYIILVGDNSASEIYIKNKIKACKNANIDSKLLRFNDDITTELLIEEINLLNKLDIDGLIVQLPLPKHINVDLITNSIDPDKDVDGFHPLNFGKMALGQPSMKPATPYGILKLIKLNDIHTNGKHIVIVGRSNLVGKPLSIMLGNDFDVGRATVTSCDINTPRKLLLDELKRADIIIIAVGKPNFLKGSMIKEGVVIIDVGINRTDDNKIVGDVNFNSVFKKCAFITPVPGGVGPMTISALLSNTLNSWRKKFSIDNEKSST